MKLELNPLASYSPAELEVLAPSPYLTAGERLLAYLRGSLLAELHQPGVVSQLVLSSSAIERDRYFASAVQDLVGFNVLARLLAAARWARSRFDGEVLVENYVRSAILNELLVDYDEVRKIYHYVAAAADASRQSVSDSLRREVLDLHGPVCYACGIELDRKSSGEKESATVEHLWPRSLGGDSDFRNLLPACMACNSNRNEHAGWAAFWFQSMFLPPRPSEEAIAGALGHRARVGLQFFRAYLVSGTESMSMKRSMLLAGPLPEPDIAERDFPIDFFSVVTFDEKVTF